MEQQRAFVASPSLVFGFKRASFVCARQDVLMCRCSHRQYRVSMIAGDQRSEKQVPVEKLLVEHSDYADMSEFIVDVDDDDDDLDENIVEVIGPDGEVKEEKRKKIRKRTGSFVDEINMPPDSALTSDADRQPPISEDETAQYIRTAVKAADERKAGDILALRVSKLTYTASFIVIATGKNSPQVRAIGNLIEEDLVKKHQMPVRRRDGTANSGWLLLDYGDFMVHILSPEQRANYNLEALWKNGEHLDISDCLSGPDQRVSVDEETVDSLDDWLS